MAYLLSLLMKKIKYIIWVFLILPTAFYILPAGLLRMPAVQKKISTQVSTYLQTKLQTEVSIGRVDLEPFNKLIIKDLYAEDEFGDVFFQTRRLSIGFDLLALFKKQLRIYSLQFYTFECNLSKKTDDSKLNIQYLIDAFAPNREIEETSSIDLQINTINLRRGRFSYRVENAEKTPEYFNSKDIHLNEIFAKIHLNHFKSKELDMKVHRLSFSEQSGFSLKKLAFDIVGNKDSLKIDHFFLQSNQSFLRLKEIVTDYSTFTGSLDRGWENVLFQMEIEPSEILLKDITPFVPMFTQFEDKVWMEGRLAGTLNDLSLTDFYLHDPDYFSVKTTAEIKNLISDPANLYLKGDVRDAYVLPEGVGRLLNNFSETTFSLPSELNNLERVSVEVNFDGNIHNMSFRGNLNSAIGLLNLNVNLGRDSGLFLKGYLSSPSLNVGTLLADSDYGDLTFDVILDAKQNERKQFEGDVNARVGHFFYKHHCYENLTLDGEFSSEHFKGLFDFDSKEGQLKAEGLFVFQGDIPGFHFQAEVNEFQLDKLNLTQKYKDASLSLSVEANFMGNNLDDVLGDLLFHSVDFSTEDGSYFLDSLWINSSQWEHEKKILFRSPILNGEIYGIYSVGNIIPSIKQSLSHYLPALIDYDSKSLRGGDNNFYLDFHLEPTDTLSRILKLPVTVQSPSRVLGQYNSIYDKFHIEVNMSQAIVMGSFLENAGLKLTNLTGDAEANLTWLKPSKKNEDLQFQVKFKAAIDSIATSVVWGHPRSKYKGELKLDALFARLGKDNYLQTRIHIHPSDLVFNDSIWKLSPAQICIDSSNVRIDNFLALHDDQLINIRGAVSNVPEEELFVRLNKVDLEYIFQSLAIKALEFGGIATGTVNVRDIYHTRQLSTDLFVKKFSFNNVLFGDLDLIGTWDDESQGILMDGWVCKNDSTTVGVDGVIYPVKEEISISFDAKNADARFLRKYLDNIVQDISGNITGKLHLFGNLNDPTVEGTVFAQDCRFFIDFLNTYYSFTDSIICLPDEIRLTNTIVYDERGREASVNGYVNHQLFKDFVYSANLSFSDFMVFNATRYSNPPFYGTIYGTGSATLYGTEDLVNIDVNVQNTENSKLTLNFTEETEVSDYDFINFVKRESEIISSVSSAVRNQVIRTDDGTEIRLNLMIDITPNATIDLIMDSSSGDKITAYGNGNMQVQYGTKIPLRVFGNYRLDRGKYNFSLQQVFFRNFDIQEGSEIIFRGDPYTAELNIDARYTVTANLGDLDQQLIKQNYSARSNVPVDCILLLGGPLNHPTIVFDLDLPGATSELSRQVKSYIRTEDMMNRQIVYLLVLGRFYTSPEYAIGNYSNDYSYLTSTLSNQLSNLLGTLSDKFSVGTKFHQTYEGEQASTEIELLLSSQLLNDRLIINGNFGYIDNPYINTAGQNVPLIGDFDIEYKLTKNGDIRLKGFNHYNYRNYFSQTPEMTQGLGILFRKDFNRFSDLFNRWRRFQVEKPNQEE